MGKVFAQHTGSAWNFSGSIATSTSANSGVFNTQGYQRLIGAIYSSASLTSGCGLQIFQSIDSGTNWDIVDKFAPAATGASVYDIEVIGNRMLISASPGGTSLTAFRALFYLQPIGTGKTLKTSSSAIGDITNILNRVSASISGGSVALLAGANDAGLVHVGTGTCIMGMVQLATGGSSFGSGSLASAIPAGEAHIGEIGGKTVAVSACVTRPADSASYIAGDMWADATTNASILRFPGCARIDGGAGVINSLIVANSASLTTQPQIYLWLFKSAITSPSDNAPFPMTNVEVEKCVGMIDFTSWYAGGSTLNSISYQRNLNIPFVCSTGCTSLWGVPVVMNSCSPTSGQNLQFRATIFQD